MKLLVFSKARLNGVLEGSVQFTLFTSLPSFWQAFSNLSEGTRTALCRLMLVAVVREPGQVVLSDGEILDTWSVILNGTVEVSPFAPSIGAQSILNSELLIGALL